VSSVCSAHPLHGPLSSSDDDGKQKNAGMWREMIILLLIATVSTLIYFAFGLDPTISWNIA